MNIEQIGLQLGLAGLIIVAVYRVAMFFISKWAENDAERTRMMQASFSRAAENEVARTKVIETNFATMIQRLDAHATEDTRSHGELGGRVSRFEGKLDEIMNWFERTPVGLEPGVPLDIPSTRSTRSSPVGHYHLRPNKEKKP